MDNIKSKVLSKIESSTVFALQLDESIDISNLSQLLVYVRYVADERINEEFLFCQPLETIDRQSRGWGFESPSNHLIFGRLRNSY